MNRSLQITFISILFLMLLSGCAQRGDHNPLGVTGGSDGGYGKNQNLYYYESAIPQSSDNINGIWSEANNLLTINSNGTFELTSGDEIRTGTYIKEKDTLILNFEDGLSVTYTYILEKGRLTLTEVE